MKVVTVEYLPTGGMKAFCQVEASVSFSVMYGGMIIALSKGHASTWNLMSNSAKKKDTTRAAIVRLRRVGFRVLGVTAGTIRQTCG